MINLKTICLALMATIFLCTSPAFSAPPKEPKAPIINIPEPDEPQPMDIMDDMRLKEPYEPIEITPKDREDIFKDLEKEPEIILFEPDIRMKEPVVKEPEIPFMIPAGEVYPICPKGMKCQ